MPRLKVILNKMRFKYQKIFFPFYDDMLRMIQLSLAYANSRIYCEKKQGEYLEFGVLKGGTLIPAYLMAKYNGTDLRFIGFDSFQGYSKGLPREKELYSRIFTDLYNIPRTELDKNLKDYGIKDIEIIEGWFNDTLTSETRSKYKIKNIKAVYIDCDLYEPVKKALDFITPSLQQGTVLMMKGWFMFANDENLGYQRATREWLSENPNIRLTPWRPFHIGSMTFIVNLK